MLSIQLIKHSLRQISGNLQAVIQLTWIVLVLTILLVAVVIMTFDLPGVAGQLPSISAGLVLLVAWLIMAVAWHRHVLLSEPSRLLTPGRGHQVFSYIGTGILIALAIIPVAFIVLALQMMAVHMLTVRTLPGHLAAIIITWVILMTLATRLSTALPGAALQIPRAIGTAWAATRGQNRMFLGLALCLFAIQIALSVPQMLLTSWGMPMLAHGVSMLTNFAWSIFALSLATTLWGHFVEGRELH